MPCVIGKSTPAAIIRAGVPEDFLLESTGSATEASGRPNPGTTKPHHDPRLNYEQSLEIAMLIVRKRKALAA